MSKAVCIYIQERDGTTTFLEPLVEHIKNMLAPVIVGYDIDSEDDPLEIIYQTIFDADTIFFFGHGTSDRLYASTVDNLTLFDKNNIDLLSGKRLILLSCNSGDFIKKHRLNDAFGFGMLPTSLDDVRKWKYLHGIHIEDFSKEDISIYNKAIVEILTHSFAMDNISDFFLLKERIKLQTSIEIVKCLTQNKDNVNYRNLSDLLFYFNEDIVIK